MVIKVGTLAKIKTAYIQPTNGNPWFECRAEIYEKNNGNYAIEYSHKPVHKVGEKGWAVDNLTWANSLEDAESCVSELFRALHASRQTEPWFT